MKFEEFVIRKSPVIIIFAVVIALLSIFPITQTRINPDLESYLPASMKSRVHSDSIAEIFGEDEPVIIIFETDDVLNPSTLERIQLLTSEFESSDAFSRVYSLANAKNIRGEDGYMLVDPVFMDIPANEEETEQLRSDIRNNDLVYKLIVSEDFRYTMILLRSNKTMEDPELMSFIHEKLEQYPGEEKCLINAMPYLRLEVNDKILRDLLVLLPLGLLIMFVFLLLSFREFRSVLLPFSIVVISILFSFALIPVFGWELSIIGVLIPIMMIAIANNYGVHFIVKYHELNSLQQDKPMKDIVRETIVYLKTPVLLTGLTTIVGLLGLVSHVLLPARQMGVISALSIGLALILSLTFIPAVMRYMKKSKVHNGFKTDASTLLIKILQSTGQFIVKHSKLTVVLFVFFLLVSATGLTRFKIAADSDGVLPAKHPFNVSAKIADRHFGGTKILQLLFRGDVKSPELMKRIDVFEHEFKQIGNVGSVTSIAGIIRKMSKALNDEGEEFYDKIPDSYEAIAQYMELYSMSGDPEDFEEFVDFNYEYTLMTVQYHADDIHEVNAVVRKIEDMLKDDPDYLFMGGYSLVDKELSEAVMKGQNYSLLFAFVAILILLIIIYRSFYAGILGILPLLFAVVSTFGIMGWLNIELNIVTALMSSISIGLGVDFTIHMFWRLKTEIKAGMSIESAVLKSLKTIGQGITINAFSVIMGFSVLFFSAFPIVQSFAFLIIVSLFLCLVCALVLIPALCMIIQPGFLKK
jgi:uncharacterized protein